MKIKEVTFQEAVVVEEYILDRLGNEKWCLGVGLM
jgi:hypothetical protein